MDLELDIKVNAYIAPLKNIIIIIAIANSIPAVPNKKKEKHKLLVSQKLIPVERANKYKVIQIISEANSKVIKLFLQKKTKTSTNQKIKIIKNCHENI